MRSGAVPHSPARRSRPTRWLPLVLLASGQMLIVSDVNALRISIGAIVDEFGISSADVQTALVVYSLTTAAFVITSAKSGALYGSLRLFRGGALLFAIALTGVALSTGPWMLVVSQAMAGAAAAALLPAVVALVAANYEGHERAYAIGVVSAAGGAVAMVLAGVLGSVASWRLPFWILGAVAALVFIMSGRLEPTARQRDVVIDWLGVLLSAGAIVLLSVAANGSSSWGLVVAKPDAPFALLGISPSLVLVLLAVVLGWLFSRHQHHRISHGRTPLVSPEAVGSKASRQALVAIVIALGVCNGYAYLLPLYMQVVQGYASLETAIWMLPYALSLSAAAVGVTRLTDRFMVRALTRSSMLLIAAGFVTVGAGIANHWGNPVVVLGLVLAGAGTGAVLTLGATVMVGASAPTMASEVGGVRHTAGNLGAAVGTALVGALLVTALNVLVDNAVTGSSVLPPELKSRAQLEQPAFISNGDLEREAEAYGLPAAQVREVVRINTDVRLNALRICFLGLAAMALLGAVAARGLPDVERERPARGVRDV